jgi:transglutaminase/protease-like cytokinesis protein 3
MLSSEQSMTVSNVGRYYYYRLSEEQKGLYSIISKCMKAFQTDIKLPMRPANEISMIVDSVLYDNPMIFYTSSYKYGNDLFKQKISFSPEYKYDKAFIKQSTDQIKQRLKAFDRIKLQSDFEKEKYVHDFCLDHFTYDYSFSDYSFSVLGPILNKTGVCQGIAKFVKLALDYVGVDCTVVAGKAKNPADGSDSTEGHMWNIVTINGKKYHLDVTFDLTVKNNLKRYDYFNLSDFDIKKDHTITTAVPECITRGNDYYTANSYTVKNPAELEKYIADKLKNGERSIIVKLTNVPEEADVVKKIGEIASQQYTKVFNKGVSVSFSYNLPQMVFEINFS